VLARVDEHPRAPAALVLIEPVIKRRLQRSADRRRREPELRKPRAARLEVLERAWAKQVLLGMLLLKDVGIEEPDLDRNVDGRLLVAIVDRQTAFAQFDEQRVHAL